MTNALLNAEDEIRVAEGTYKPSIQHGNDSRSKWFLIDTDVDGVTIEGGYAGVGAANPDLQDFEAHPTILSGDIDAGGDDSYHVVVASGISSDTAATILRGFTITGGLADGDDTDDGGLPENHRNKGGGIYAVDSVLNIIQCTIEGNVASGKGFNGHGGGAAVQGNRAGMGTVHFLNCTFRDNTANRGSALALIGDEVGGGGVSAHNQGVDGALPDRREPGD